jgi:hypothetical protein
MRGFPDGTDVVEVGVLPLPVLSIRSRRRFMMLVIAAKRSAESESDYKIQSDNHSLVETPPSTLTGVFLHSNIEHPRLTIAP